MALTMVVSLNSLCHGYPLAEPLKWVPSLEFFQLNWRKLVQKFIDWHVAAANPDQNAALFNPHADFFRAKFIDPTAVPHEHNFEPVAVGVVVDELGHFVVDRVVLDRNVDSDSRLQVNDVGFQGLALNFEISHLLQQIKWCLVCRENLIFQLGGVLRGRLEFLLEALALIVALAELGFVLCKLTFQHLHFLEHGVLHEIEGLITRDNLLPQWRHLQL